MDIIGAFPGQADTLAIDNIRFINCGRPKPTSGSCPSGQIKCKNNICMNAYGLCDNLNDCGDKSDEFQDICKKLQVNSCTFELSNGGRPACNWTQEFDPGSTALWKTLSSLQANTDKLLTRMTGPTTDHTNRETDKYTNLILFNFFVIFNSNF